jgi:hypothetical protein
MRFAELLPDKQNFVKFRDDKKIRYI